MGVNGFLTKWQGIVQALALATILGIYALWMRDLRHSIADERRRDIVVATEAQERYADTKSVPAIRLTVLDAHLVSINARLDRMEQNIEILTRRDVGK